MLPGNSEGIEKPEAFRNLHPRSLHPNIGALIIRIGCWGPLCYSYTKEPPQNSIGNYLGPLP